MEINNNSCYVISSMYKYPDYIFCPTVGSCSLITKNYKILIKIATMETILRLVHTKDKQTIKYADVVFPK